MFKITVFEALLLEAGSRVILQGKLDSGSYEDLRNRLSAALKKKFPRQNINGENDGYCCYIVATFPDQVVYEHGAEYYSCSWSELDGEIIFGDPTEVKRKEIFEPVKEALAASSDPEAKEILADLQNVKEAFNDELGDVQIIEALDTNNPDGGGWLWSVVLLESGISKNGREYPVRVLDKLAKICENAKAFDGHRDLKEKVASSARNLVGWYTDLKVVKESVGSSAKLVANFHITKSAKWLRDNFMTAYKAKNPSFLGISIDAVGKVVKGPKGLIVEDVRDRPQPTFDVVAFPAAGGRVERLIASEQIERTEEPMNLIQEALKHLETMTLVQLQESFPDHYAALVETGMTKEEEAPVVKKTVEEPTDKTVSGLTEADVARIERAEKISCNLILRDKLAGSKLPEATQVKITESFADQIFTEEAVDAVIESERAYLAKISETGRITDFGQTRDVDVIQESMDLKKLALDGFFANAPQQDAKGENVKPFWSFHEAYSEITGKHGIINAAEVLQECMPVPTGSNGKSWDRIKESLDSTSFAQVLGDSVARRLLAEYAVPGLDDWRKIVSNIENIKDFRTNRRGRIGGYGTLPTVAQGGTYQPLTSPGDEEATYTITKKGGLEDLTEEAIANDDVQLIRAIPRKLGRAAAQTLYRGVFDILSTNPVCSYDTTDLFHANHSNLGSTALAAAELSVVKRIFREVVAYGDSSEVLSLVPRWLAVPAELEDTAYRLTTTPDLPGSTNNDRNIHASYGLGYVVVPYWTDATNWYAICNPMDCPTIEVGFYQGKQEPELWVQDTPNVGSRFTADKITYKIRHIWQICILDHRGMYGEVVA